ncbi:hypothetical protein PR001_g13461 [Phytophthora rubi]|uniref:Uncharacterized protein n=1 Tax=Phytophthora rubi TaxID=129364 RepID=A0A6A3LS85_9STRA|nr:hypothetical protein PR002_g13803 [Phytophthora rubi]KAE9020995.1 hypothetical protein PR001_g13461 [Phytophthora rubi]
MDRCKLEADIAVIAAKLEESLDSTEEVLDHGLSLFDEVEAYLTHSVYDSSSECKPDANIVVLGTTGTGKSTVVSFLFGKGRMLVHHESPFSHVLVSEVPLPGVAIRSGSDSTTLLPICNHVRLGEEVIAAWDMPGSRDTRGPFVELLVHFIFKWMLVDDKTLRFIIVSPPLHERPQIAFLQNTINGSLIRAENAVLVYTKCSWDFDPDSTADLKTKESKRGIRSFALPAPVKSDSEGHDYTAQYHEEKCEILTTLAELRSDSVKFEDPLPDASQRLLDKFRESSVAFARDKISTCFLKVNLEDAEQKLRATVSCGQRGGNAQNGGDGVNGGDSVYSLKDFENEVDCATKNGLLEKEEGTIDEIRITSYKTRISPLAGRFYGTQGLKEWSLVEESKSGACGTRPGSGGIGGFGGKGGSLRIHEGAEVWEGTGAMGEQGDDGASGQPSRDGRASPTFSAVVHLWHFERGWYHGTMSDPEISLEPPTPIATPPLMYATPATGAGASPAENFSLGLQYVKANYQAVRKHLEDKFGKCDFSNLKSVWDNAD